MRCPPVGNASRPVRYQSAGRRHRLAGTLQYPPVSKCQSVGTLSAVSDAGRPVRYPPVGDTGRPVRYAGRKYRSAGTLSAGRQYRSAGALSAGQKYWLAGTLSVRRSATAVGRYAAMSAGQQTPVGWYVICRSAMPVGRCAIRRSVIPVGRCNTLVGNTGRPVRYPPRRRTATESPLRRRERACQPSPGRGRNDGSCPVFRRAGGAGSWLFPWLTSAEIRGSGRRTAAAAEMKIYLCK